MWATWKVKDVDYVMAVSQPPILGGLLGVWGKWTRRAKMIYQIQDFNPEQVMAVGYSHNRMLLALMKWLDLFSCRRSALIITVGRDMVATLEGRFRGKVPTRYAFINNWVDEKEIYPLEKENEKVMAFRKKYGLEDKYVIMYSGNLGLYYDLEQLIRVIKQFRKGYKMDGTYESGPRTFSTPEHPQGQEVVFVFVGAGSVMSKLQQYVEKHHFENVRFIPYQDREELPYSLNAGDVHWCVNAKGIKGVSVPSKAYGIMAAGKPILGVLENGSEVRELIAETGCGLCCEPGDYGEVAALIRWFIDHAYSDEVKEMGQKGREYLVKRLSKETSIQKYRELILHCGEPARTVPLWQEPKQETATYSNIGNKQK